ncbi:adventurous gliding motility protein GltC [Vulgatibacter incomptus]|nr:adventurous gliding motility protein GltC [Vulgatibacter incomptus]
MRNVLAAMAAVLLVASPLAVHAQISFEGLDLSDDSDSKKPAPARRAPPKQQPKRRAPPPPPRKSAPAAPPVQAAPEAPAQPKALPTRPPPTLSFEGFDVTGKTADRQKLDAAMRLFQEKSFETAALGFHEILQDPTAADQHPQAEYLLGKSLYRLGMYHSSLSVFRRILDRGEAHPYFATSLEWLFFIAHKATNQTVVLDEIARFAGVEFPEKYRDEYRYLLAKYNFVRGKALLDAAQGVDEAAKRGHLQQAQESFDEARRLLAMVPRGSRFNAKARYLDGLTLYVNGKFTPALEAFKDVVRALNPRRGGVVDTQLREQALMQLARIHYEHGQNRFAAFYYSRIARGSEQWLQSLYEASWAHFRLGENEQALGNMITLQSPFFRDEYFPEAMVLQSVIYYENCRYPEANRIVEEFRARYYSLYAELEKILARPFSTPQDYYGVLADLQKDEKGGETNRMLQGILKLALSDKELRHLNDSILELEGELDGIASRRELFRFSGLAKSLIADLDAQRVELQRKAGFYAKRKLEKERKELASLNYRALAIKAEIGTSEKDVLEASLSKGKRVSPIENYKYSTAVDDEHVYWPYEGEFWRDELGTYQYTLTKGCKGR